MTPLAHCGMMYAQKSDRVMRALTSFVGNFFAIGSFTPVSIALLAIMASAMPALAQQQPQPIVPSPFQGLANVLRNPDAPRPRPRAQPAPQPAPPPTMIPPGALNNGAR